MTKRNPYRVHMAMTDPGAGIRSLFTACGLKIQQERKHSTNNLPLASRIDKITCSNCLMVLYGNEARSK